MRSVLLYTLVFSVASVFSQQPFVRYSENLRKAVPHHFNHDKKNADRSVDKIARGHKVEPRQPPLRPQQTVPWLKWVHEGRWAAQADRNSEILKMRAKLLAEKLKPNQFNFKPQINPQLKPKINKKENARIKREIEESRIKFYKEIEVQGNVRHKRDLMVSQQVPKVVMPSQDQFGGRIKETEKRDKRQILYFINRPPQLLARSPRTTPNPFIRDTHIDDYDIIRPEVGEREGMIPTVESGSSDPGSYPLVREESNEFTGIISQFYLTTSDEHWPAIQHFSENILRPLSQLTEKKKELLKALKDVKDVGEYPKENLLSVLQHQIPPINKDEKTNHNRVKRRVNKTLQRKRAKKKKQRLRRFERKRLRMLTHARRVRRQQKSKQARLQRHYARMNMSTTATPDHLKNKTMVGKDHDEQQSVRSDSRDDETDEEDVEYESSEYEDEDESETKSQDTSKGGTSKTSENDSEESDDSNDDSEESEVGSKPDYGNDDYEEYDESDDEYEDESSEESVKKKKGKGKKVKAEMKSREKQTLRMLSQQLHGGKQKVKRKKNSMMMKKYPRELTKIKTKQDPDAFQRNNILRTQPLELHSGKIKSKGQLSPNNMNKHKDMGKENYENGESVNVFDGTIKDLKSGHWISALSNKKFTNGFKPQIAKI